MVVVGGIIGAGIFINPYIVAQRLDSPAWVIAVWVAGGLIALAGAFAFAELGALFPRAGGPYVYMREAFHPVLGFLYGWASLLLIQGGGLAAVAITFATYSLRFIGRPDASVTILAILAIIVVAAINYIGVKPGSRVLNVLVVLKVLALAALIGAGFLLPSAPATDATLPDIGMLPIVAFGAALVPVMFSYGGWQSVNWVAEELREPERDLPRALVMGTLIVVTTYVLVNIVYLRALGHAGLAATQTPAADAAARAFGPGGDRFITGAIALSTFGFLNLTLLAPPRIFYAMAADGLFFPAVSRLHPRFHTPSVAILLMAGWAILLALTGSYAQLVDTVVFADWIFFGLAVAAVFVFRRRIPVSSRAPGTYAAPGYPVVPALFVIMAAYIVVSVIAANPVRSGVGALLLLAGVPAYAYWRSRS